jgi:hypothetical protein
VIAFRRRARVESLPPRSPASATLLAAVVAILAGCEQDSQRLLIGHAIRERDFSRVTIGRSTVGDVEQVFGPPDEQAPDGSLVYLATAVRRSARSIAGFSWGSEEEVLERREARFRFADGVLVQVCRERS